MASGKSLEKAEELVNKLFYVPAYTADDLESRDDNDERVISIATALDEARSEAIEVENKLRRLLWLRHGCDGLYGDDGEMQCSRCVIDFKRDNVDDIIKSFESIAVRKLKEKP